MKSIKELSQNKVYYATGYNDCKKDVLKLIDKAKIIITGNVDGELISKRELKARIEG